MPQPTVGAAPQHNIAHNTRCCATQLHRTLLPFITALVAAAVGPVVALAGSAKAGLSTTHRLQRPVIRLRRELCPPFHFVYDSPA